MKRHLLSLFLFLICFSSYSQDTIVKTNGNKTLAKVIEIGSTQIKYKKYDFQDGPTYVEDKSSIRMIVYSNGQKEEFTTLAPAANQYSLTKDTIRKSNAIPDPNADYYGGPVNVRAKIKIKGSGFLYDDTRINERKLHQILRETKDKQLIDLVGQSRDAHKLKFVGFGAIPLGIASLVLYANSYNVNNGKFSQDKLAASGICFFAAMACPAVSSYFSAKRKNCNKAAIKLYNERY